MTIFKKKAAAVLIAAILIKRRRDRSSKKRLWVRNLIRNRETENINQNLLRDLRNDESDGFKTYFRISSQHFDFLLEKVRPLISKKDTRMRKAISAEVRLAITLRYLSSGDSFRSLELLFRVAHNTISGIVSATCKAIYSVLLPDFLKVGIKMNKIQVGVILNYDVI